MKDALFRMMYRGAYKMMRVYWAVLHPQTHGALVLIWQGGEVLLVRNSYVHYYSAPGGYVRAGETGRQAAAREMREETRVMVDPARLQPALDEHHTWEGKHEHIEIFQLEVEQRPTIHPDNREVVQARFYAPSQALELPLFPPLRRVIEARAKAA